jgi:hypothetical protein
MLTLVWFVKKHGLQLFKIQVENGQSETFINVCDFAQFNTSSLVDESNSKWPGLYLMLGLVSHIWGCC